MAQQGQAESTEEILPDAEFGASPDALETQTAVTHDLPVAFVRYSHEPLGANALVFALLMSSDPELMQRQLAIVDEAGVAGLSELVSPLTPGILELAAPQRLPLLEMCLPALKSTSAPQYRRFKNTMMKLIQANARTDLYELANCYPLLKPRVLKAMTLAASYDGYLSAPEREIIASMAAVMDCPVPSVDSQALDA